MTIPMWVLFVQGFATGFLTTWLGLVLVNIHPSIRKLAAVGLCYGVLAVLIRNLPLLFGLHFYLLTILLIFLVQLIWNLPFIEALVTVILGNLIMALGEALFLSAILNLLHINIATLMSNQTYLLLAPLPQIVIMILLTCFLSRQKIFIFNFNKSVPSLDYTKVPRGGNKLIFMLTVVVLILFVLQVFCIEAVYNIYPSRIFRGISVEGLGTIMSGALIITTLIMFYFIVQLIKLFNQENKFAVQQTYLETVDEMVVAIRAQQHDQISHMQTLYGYLQLEYFNEARLYLEEMIGQVNLSHQFVNIEDVGLSALTYTKSAFAAAHGITFNVSVNTDLKQLTVPPYELNRIINNLINNSFDYVSDLELDRRQVWFRVDRKGSGYVFEVANYGHIDDHMAGKIFSKGFTSKAGDHAGLGLSIVEALVKHHGGRLIFTNKSDKVIFTIYLPAKEVKYDTARPDISSLASQKFFKYH